jgi:Fur family ferric uptake transcriptional regulator
MDNTRYVELLEQHGIRPTSNRIVVAKALAEAEHPASIADLERRILTIDKSGIFRSLMLFRDHHLVHALEDGEGGVKYELCHSHDDEEDDDQHVHFYCERCHEIYCLYDMPVPQVEVPEGYEVRSVNYLIKGLCPKCSAHQQ